MRLTRLGDDVKARLYYGYPNLLMGTVDESLVPPPRRRSAFITVALGGPAVVRFYRQSVVSARLAF